MFLCFSPLVMLKAMDHKSPEAKRQMIAECRAQCRGITRELDMIDTFERTYQPNDALHWYTKTGFLYRVTNKALRSANVLDQYTFRYYIVDLHTQLEEAALATRASCTAPFYVYRGATLIRDEIEQLHEGTLVATKGFFSSSRDFEVAQHFICINPDTGMSPSRSRDDINQFVLFHIHLDLTKSCEAIVVDVSRLSAVPAENEMTFNLGTTFRVTHINYDSEHYVWHVELILSSEVAQLTSDYSEYIRKRLTEINARLLFGNVLADMSNDVIGALTYFHRLLRTIPTNDEDRPNIYFHLARVYRYMGMRQQAITYYQCAQLLQRRTLPQSKFDYARTLSGLGLVYSELNQSNRAAYLQTKAMVILRSILPDDHLEVVHVTSRLAYACWQNNQCDHAHILLSTVLSFFKRKMPPDHPAEAQSLHTMGLVHRTLGNRDQAIDCFKKALRIRELLLASDDPTVAHTCLELSIVYAERDDDKEIALDYAKKAMRIQQAKVPPNQDDLKRIVELVEQLSTNNDEV